MFVSKDMNSPYDGSKILAIAATCLPHSRVSLLSLFLPGLLGRNTSHACYSWQLSIRC
jgi:hypothetical protein